MGWRAYILTAPYRGPAAGPLGGPTSTTLLPSLRARVECLNLQQLPSSQQLAVTNCLSIGAWLMLQADVGYCSPSMAVVAIVAALSCAGAAHASWSTFMHDPVHTGFAPVAGPATSGTTTSVLAQATAPVWTGVTVAQDASTGVARFFFGDNSGLVQSVGLPQSGVAPWTFQTKNLVLATPTVLAGRVFVGSYDGSLHCLDASTGAPLWEGTVKGYIGSSVGLSPQGDIAYFGGGCGLVVRCLFM